jgi:hypothetical protein
MAATSAVVPGEDCGATILGAHPAGSGVAGSAHDVSAVASMDAGGVGTERHRAIGLSHPNHPIVLPAVNHRRLGGFGVSKSGMNCS